jgi:hypothetical protein
MLGRRNTIPCWILVSFIVIWCSSASAGLLNTGLSYVDSYGRWEGSSTFNHSATGGYLKGRVEWAVFTAQDYLSLFPNDYQPTPGELVYAYQVFADNNSVEISKAMAPLLNGAPADHEGYFTASGMGGVVPSSTSITLGTVTTVGDVIWNFSNPNIDSSEHSTGLVFSSVRKPRTDWYIVVDGGTPVNVLGVGGPGTVPIPEPGTLALLLTAAAAFCSTLILRKRKMNDGK